VYQTESASAVEWTTRGFWTRGWRTIAPNVWFLGITSLLTDISSEMVASVLPMYLVLQLNLSPLAFGTLDGLYNGIAAITRWSSGVVADRWRRHKEVAAAGYAVSAVCRLALLAVGRTWIGLAFVIASDRLAKGIRTAPRDALISLSAPRAQLAESFGVHRALDATGAMIGPIVALGLLALVPHGFDVVFVTSFCIAVVGLGVLLLFVQNVSPGPAESSAPRPSVRTALALLRRSDFRVVTIATSGLAFVTISDAFVYLALQQRLRFAPEMFPLLYVGTALSYLLFAIPAGTLADRFGRPRMFLLGHGVLWLMYVLLIVPAANALTVPIAVCLLGAYYAATDGVMAALVSGMLPTSFRGSGLALVATATSVSRLAASIAFGWVWTMWSRDIALVGFTTALGCGVVVAAIAMRRYTWSPGS
jgi:MFS family permease